MNYLAECQLHKTILIVDDRPNNLQLLLQYLKSAEYKILMAQSGTDAIAIAEVYHPDLILLDVMMPGISGFETCIQLKEKDSTKNIPIIFMTALSATENQVKGFALGAVDYIAKPIEREVLLARVKTHLHLQSLNQRLTQELKQQQLLSKISDRISQCLDLNCLFQSAVSEIQTFLACDRLWLTNLDDDNNLVLKAEANTLGVKLDQEISWHEFCDHQEEHLVDLQGDIWIVNPIKNQDTKEELSPTEKSLRIIAPIQVKATQVTDHTKKQQDRNNLWGWLIIEYDSALLWQAEKIKVIEILTTQLAIGIQQALLYEQLTQQVSVDALTQVYNRRYFDRQLNLEWRRLKRTSSYLSLIMCDIDYFKLYNDTYGHQEGDKCLQKVAQALSSTINRSGDFLARYGGEEFVIILPQTSQAGAIKVAEKIGQTVKNLKIPHQNSLVDSIVTLSMGVATTVPNNIDNTELLIEAADRALYLAKERGRDRTIVYSEAISHVKNREKLKIGWIKRLRCALEKNLFSLYAQSITPLKGDDLRRFEVLLRLKDEADKVILPGVFLDIAERNCLMTEIDTWVINNLFETLEKCDRTLLDDCYFSVNLSGSSLNDESFLQFLRQRIIEYSLPPKLFCFEITESVAVSNLERAVEFINSLKAIGCTFALDDFGKGASSLTYLENLPVDYLKIDGSFIRQLNVNPVSRIMLEAIEHIAKGIGLQTIAEFVENEAILNSVRDLNVDYAQGFHLSRPIALVDAISI